ncbi:MAG: hypothetical protein Kow0080_16210 [Candidatus Promineifilaceae bacterium]
MPFIRGYYRLCLSLVALAFGATLVIITSYLPFKIGEYQLSHWLLQWVGRAILRTVNIRVVSDDQAVMQKHHGFFFPNHVSYIDILVLISVAPTRFLAKAEVRKMPFVGMAAQAVGCVFVKREDKQSRIQARHVLAAMTEYFPAVTIFPEGRRSETHELLPFRYGAFEIAVQGEIPILPCLITYDRPDLIIWPRKQNVFKGVLTLASRARQPIVARVTALPAIYPTQTDNPVALSQEAHAQMTAVYQQIWPLEPTAN